MKSLFIPLFCALIFFLSGCSESISERTPKAKVHTKEFEDISEDSLIVWIVDLKKKSQSFRDNNEPEKALSPLNKCIEDLPRPANSEEEYIQMGWAHVNRAYIHEQLLGNYLNAKQDYLTALNFFHKAKYENFFVARYVLQPLGNIHTRFGENEQALLMLSKFKSISEENGEVDALTNAYNDIGRVHLNKKDHDLAIACFKAGIDYNTANPINTGLLYSSLAEAYLFNNEPDEGIYAAKKSEFYFEKAVKSTDSSNFEYILIKKYKQETKKTHGNLLRSKGNYDESISTLNDALKDASKVYPRKHREIGKIHLGLAKCNVTANNLEDGLNHYQQVLVSMVPNFESTSIFDTPEIDDLYADVTIGESLAEKAKTLALLHTQNNDIEYLKASIKTYLKYFNWEKTLRSEHQNENSKLRFSETNHGIGEDALKISCLLNEIEPNNGWAETGFKIIDITKSMVLEDTRERNLNQSKLKNSDSSFYEAKQLKVQLSLLSIQLNEAKLAKDSLTVIRVKKQMEKLDERSQLLHFNLKQKYPLLKEYSNDLDEEINLDSLKNQLAISDASVLNYFVGDSSLFIAVLDKKKVSLQELSFNTFSSNLNKHLESVKNTKQADALSFEQTAHQLYATIFPAGIFSGKNLIIIPDGRIHELAFETLVSSVNKKNSFKNLEYLIYNFNISYSPSARFILNSTGSSSELKPYLGVAPTFKDDSDLAWLNHSEKEIHIGEKYMGGDVKIGQQATKEFLIKNIENYNIVHISTHASKGSNQNNDGWMALTAGERLQTPEVYQLSLNSNLVILNACETGLGEHRKGEGTRSMTTGFLSSGANNVITNLWEANHISNLKLLENFYINLSSDSQPSESLRQSKISYLKSEETSEFNAHPYYWAAPVLIGTNNSIQIKQASSFSFIWYLLGITILIVAILYFRKK